MRLVCDIYGIQVILPEHNYTEKYQWFYCEQYMYERFLYWRVARCIYHDIYKDCLQSVYMFINM